MKDLNLIVLSALLHDIGKFAQRANRPYSENMIDVYLTTQRKGNKGHWHTLYTDYFIEKDLLLPPILEKNRSFIARTASAHHRPDDKLSEMCITIADRLSSGAERKDDETEENKTGFRQSRLVSIFDEIELVKHTFKSPGNVFHQLTPLKTDSEDFFPLNGKPAGPEDDYVRLFDDFLEELKNINKGLDFHFYLDSLISILEKYTWCIPSSSYHTIPDVSLFDHALSTAAFAQALYMYHNEKKTIPQWHDSEEKFILLSGDLSGIQSYIFDISRDSGKGVSKIFRARSFYLQAVTKSVLLEIQKRLGLFSVCRLIDSGGKFILLLPNTDKCKTNIKQVIKDCDKWFLNKFKGLLTMNFSEPLPLKHDDYFDNVKLSRSSLLSLSF